MRNLLGLQLQLAQVEEHILLEGFTPHIVDAAQHLAAMIRTVIDHVGDDLPDRQTELLTIAAWKGHDALKF